MSSVDVMLRKKSEKSEANRIVRCFREHGQSRRLPQPQPISQDHTVHRTDPGNSAPF